MGCEGEGSVRVSGHIHGCSLAYGRGTMGKAVEDLKVRGKVGGVGRVGRAIWRGVYVLCGYEKEEGGVSSVR